jgi:hypothetical protein
MGQFPKMKSPPLQKGRDWVESKLGLDGFVKNSTFTARDSGRAAAYEKPSQK